jgi:hypothetical protein
VLAVDFIGRFRGRNGAAAGDIDQVQLARVISLAIGAVVVLLSSFVALVQGNLLEIAHKVVNLLRRPSAPSSAPSVVCWWSARSTIGKN